MKGTISDALIESLMAAGFVALMLSGVALWWVLRSNLEARAYNELTDSNVTTWQAMFVELRVEGEL